MTQAPGRFGEALKLSEEALSRQKAKLGPDHSETLIGMTNLASSLADAGRREEAMKLREDALSRMKATLGPDHPTTLALINNLAVSYADAGRLAEALKLRKEALSRMRKKLGPDHLYTLQSMHNLANSYSDAGRLGEALKLREEALSRQKATLGPDHPATLTGMSNLADSYRDAGRFGEALKLHEEALIRTLKNIGASLRFGWMHGKLAGTPEPRHARRRPPQPRAAPIPRRPGGGQGPLPPAPCRHPRPGRPVGARDRTGPRRRAPHRPAMGRPLQRRGPRRPRRSPGPGASLPADRGPTRATPIADRRRPGPRGRRLHPPRPRGPRPAGARVRRRLQPAGRLLPPPPPRLRAARPQAPPRQGRPDGPGGFQKKVHDRLGEVARAHPGRRVEVWFEDEARFGQKGALTTVRAPRGSRPTAVRQTQYDYLWVIAAACPATGAATGIIMPHLDTDVVNVFLGEFSRQLAPDVHAVLIWDGFHTARAVEVPANVTLVGLPPYAPELNPVENLWHYLRSHHWSNRSYADWEALKEAAAVGLVAVGTDAERIKSVCAAPYTADWDSAVIY